MGTPQDFKTFMKQRKEAATAYVGGNAAPLAAVSAQDLPATFMGPGGGAVRGTQEVSARYARDARVFEAGGTTELEILDMAAGETIAYWTGFQKARVRMHGKPDVIQMKLRVTEVFRREGDDWKLVHRHADSLAEVNELAG
jgi:ketosteroid isomerase-like protein